MREKTRGGERKREQGKKEEVSWRGEENRRQDQKTGGERRSKLERRIEEETGSEASWRGEERRREERKDEGRREEQRTEE